MRSRIVLSACVLSSLLSLTTEATASELPGAPPQVTDPIDRQILEAFLRHVETSARWLEYKYLLHPRWRSGAPAENATLAAFLSQAKNRALVGELAFEIKSPGYQAPKTPAQMKPMPGTQD